MEKTNEEKLKKSELTYGEILKTQNNYVLSINDLIFITEDEDTLLDLYEEHTSGSFRKCQVCGDFFDAGYMVEGGTFYACSDECFKKDADKRYGKGNWKATDDMTESEKENLCTEEMTEDSYHVYLGKDKKWHPDDTFYTEWF